MRLPMGQALCRLRDASRIAFSLIFELQALCRHASGLTFHDAA